jgi:hypothetical protein
VFLRGVLEKVVVLVWCLGGENVVLSVVGVVLRDHSFGWQKMRQSF